MKSVGLRLWLARVLVVCGLMGVSLPGVCRGEGLQEIDTWLSNNASEPLDLFSRSELRETYLEKIRDVLRLRNPGYTNEHLENVAALAERLIRENPEIGRLLWEPAPRGTRHRIELPHGNVELVPVPRLIHGLWTLLPHRPAVGVPPGARRGDNLPTDLRELIQPGTEVYEVRHKGVAHGFLRVSPVRDAATGKIYGHVHPESDLFQIAVGPERRWEGMHPDKMLFDVWADHYAGLLPPGWEGLVLSDRNRAVHRSPEVLPILHGSWRVMLGEAAGPRENFEPAHSGFEDAFASLKFPLGAPEPSHAFARDGLVLPEHLHRLSPLSSEVLHSRTALERLKERFQGQGRESLQRLIAFLWLSTVEGDWRGDLVEKWLGEMDVNSRLEVAAALAREAARRERLLRSGQMVREYFRDAVPVVTRREFPAAVTAHLDSPNKFLNFVRRLASPGPGEGPLSDLGATGFAARTLEHFFALNPNYEQWGTLISLLSPESPDYDRVDQSLRERFGETGRNRIVEGWARVQQLRQRSVSGQLAPGWERDILSPVGLSLSSGSRRPPLVAGADGALPSVLKTAARVCWESLGSLARTVSRFFPRQSGP